MAEVAGIVLAGGAGRRYGKPKVLAHGGAWLRAAVDALRGGGCAPVIVVLGATGPVADPAWPAGVRYVWAAEWAAGMSASLRAGLAAAAATTAEFAAIMPVDTPDVGPEVIARVVDAAVRAPAGLARAVFDAGPGHPVVLARRHWPVVRSAAHGDAGARQFLAANASDVVPVRCGDLATGADHDYP